MCPICTAASKKTLKTIVDGDPLARCEACEVVYLPRAHTNFDESNEYYYRARIDGYSQSELNAHRLKELFAKCSEMTAHRRFLDVGCGWGEAVAVGGEVGWHGWGIDLAKSAIASCKSRGLNCDVIDFFDLDPNVHSFDLIIMSEFLEHVPQTNQWLQHAWLLLAEGGLLYVTTPNYNSLGRRALRDDWPSLGAWHIIYFTPKRLKRALTDAGFQKVSLVTRNPSIALFNKVLGRMKAPSTGGISAADSSDQLRSRAFSLRRYSILLRITNLALALFGCGETIVVFMKKEKLSRVA